MAGTREEEDFDSAFIFFLSRHHVILRMDNDIREDHFYQQVKIFNRANEELSSQINASKNNEDRNFLRTLHAELNHDWIANEGRLRNQFRLRQIEQKGCICRLPAVLGCEKCHSTLENLRRQVIPHA
jgi:hypothetical protein